jgi:hypothetical protein
MAANDPGLASLNAPAEDPIKGAVDVPVEDTPVAPDQFDPKYETTRKEIWSYYSYEAVTLDQLVSNFCLLATTWVTMA